MSESSERVAIIFTGITACFSYEGYRYNKEKFRLELFEKRWEVYEAAYAYLNAWINLPFDADPHGKMLMDIETLYNKASLALMVFGKEVSPTIDLIFDLHQKAEDGFSYTVDEEKQADNIRAKNHLSQMLKMFSPYLYFGDYKSPQPTSQINLCDLCALCSKKITLTIAQIKKFITCSKI